jgi:TolA-binding protein
MDRSRPHPLARPGAWLLLALLATAGGCRTGGTSALARWRMAFDDSLAKAPTDDEAGRQRLLARWINPRPPESKAAEVGDGLILGSNGWTPLKPPSDPQADAEFRAAESLFQQGQLAEAEAAFKKLAKRKKDTPWGEKAQFYLAECQFQQGRFVAAHDSYELLIATYPGTQFLEKAVAREYAIADAWLAAVAEDAEPEQRASFRKKWEGKLPAIDTAGHALATLEHVRHHDPFGPLADDAVLRIADYHYSQQNYEDAALYYDQLISEHPKSPFLQRAQLASIDSKIKGYLGPDYDGAGLEQARDQALQAMALFPERQAQAGGPSSLEHTLDIINEQMAERAYRRGEHYLWTGKVTSAEYCFGEIPVKWPKSRYAQQAKEQLAKIAAMPRKETKASRMMALPGSTDPLTGSSGASASSFGSGPGGVQGLGSPVGP